MDLPARREGKDYLHEEFVSLLRLDRLLLAVIIEFGFLGVEIYVFPCLEHLERVVELGLGSAGRRSHHDRRGNRRYAPTELKKQGAQVGSHS